MKRKTLDAIRAHYAHARAKHPHFCDRLEYLDEQQNRQSLDHWRAILANEVAGSVVAATTVLCCEIAELRVELARGDNARAREEALDCIAVLLRIIDELEARP